MFYEFYGCKNTVFLLKCKIFSAKLNFKFCAQCAAENIQGIKVNQNQFAPGDIVKVSVDVRNKLNNYKNLLGSLALCF